MKKILAVLFALLAPVSAQAQQSKATLQSSISTLFADNTSNAITAAMLRSVTSNIVSSYVDWLTCTTSGAMIYYVGGTPTCLVAGTSSQVFVGGTVPVWTSTLPSGLSASSMTLPGPAIQGGTASGITSFGLRDTSAAFDVNLAASSSTTLTAGRTLTYDVGNVAHTLKLGTTANTITFPNLSSYNVITSGDTGTVTNTILANSATTVNGQTCTLGSTCTVTAAAGTLTGTTLASNVVSSSLTTVGTIGTGVWQGTVIALAFGGTNANLTASNGGMHYSTASATAILSGTATASLPLLSGSSAAPTWAAITYPASASSGGIAYFSSATALASSGTLTANQIMVGGGSGASPTTFACATTTTVVHGGTPPTCGQIVNADITTATITNASLAVAADSTIKSNISGGSASPSDNTITAVLDKQFGTTQGTVVYRGASTWAALTPGTSGQFLTTGGTSANPTWSSGGAGTGTVTSITPGAGHVSSVTAACSQTAITAAGTVSTAECTNAQTGTTYAIVDGDRGKLVTASNAASQAYSIAQAGNSSAFQAGWYVDVSNVSTNALGVVTITPTTSTINGAATLKVLQGQSVRIVSDGTNYQISQLTGSRAVKIQTFTSNGTYTPSTGLMYAIIECVGGGGGGGGVAATSVGHLVAGGGGSGSYSKKVSTAATIGASQTVTIGASGAGATAGLNNGGSGGDTSVDSLCIGKGGSGGGGTSVAALSTSGIGGVAGTGDVTTVGNDGGGGSFNPNAGVISTYAFSGNGGAGFFGGSPGNTAADGAGKAAAANSGSGGAGALENQSNTNYAGGAGGSGFVVITEYTTQ